MCFRVQTNRRDSGQMVNRIIIAYACEKKGSEPGVGFQWAHAISEIKFNEDILIITRKNNDIHDLTTKANVRKLGIDLPYPLLLIKKVIGIRLYYFIWKALVFVHLVGNFRQYRECIIHHITFTPIYYPPLYFILPFKFIWGPIGGGEKYPLAYLKEMRKRDAAKEIIRFCQVYSIYINPLFYLGCYNSVRIICSTSETACLIPKVFQRKVAVELMVFDDDKVLNDKHPENIIVIANRLIHWKMTHLFVCAFKKFLERNESDYTLLIIGAGPYHSRIKSISQDNENIQLVDLFATRDEMFSVLQKASLFVSMSLRDSGAASVLEALSLNVPILVTASGAHKHFLSEQIGYSFSIENFEEDVGKIVSILEATINNPNTLSDERRRIKYVYKSVFSTDAKYSRIRDLLNV